MNHRPTQRSPRPTRLALALSAALGAAGLLAPAAQAGPQGGQVTAGIGSISQGGAAGQTTTTVQQNSQNLSLSWQSFNLGAAETVNFLQPSASAIAVNRIQDTRGSQILGRIQANGQVWLINPHGVLFGRSAQVDVGGLVASTLDVADGELSSATRRFGGSSSTSTASVINQGRLTAAEGGYVALLGHQVLNQGHISARLGTVALGAGSVVSLNFDGSRLLGLQVEQNALDALADNGGLLQADGGQVLMSAGARDSLLASVVNQSGVVQAQTVQEHEGRIILLGGMAAGTTKVAGRLDASAPGGHGSGGNGGFIETSALNVQVADGAVVTTLAAAGRSGTWLIDPLDFTIASGSGTQTTSSIGASTLSANLDRGDVTLLSLATGSQAGDIHVNAPVSWSANHTLTLNSWRHINLNAPITATGANGKLSLYYGQGTSNGVISGVEARYFVNAPVNLRAGRNFATQLGFNGSFLDWKVITALGAAGSTTGNDLQGIQGNQDNPDILKGNYVLGADIDASSTSGWNAGAGFQPIGSSRTPFTGRFDGLGHRISGLVIHRPNILEGVGLFSHASGGLFRNLDLADLRITGRNYVGGLVGRAMGDTGQFSGISATGHLSGGEFVGGLVGDLNGSIDNSRSAVEINGSGSTGGLVGSLRTGSITDSYATGSVSGRATVGGLLGYMAAGSVTSTYATGRVTGTQRSTGGLLGYYFAGTLKDNYWDQNSSDRTQGVGFSSLFGNTGSQTGVTGLTTTQALTQSSYTGWDFTNTWFMVGGSTRPFLRSEWSTTITSARQLQLMAVNLGASYTLARDLDLRAELSTDNQSGMWGGQAAGFAPIGSSASASFTGSFAGQGHAITGLRINRPTLDGVGLFGWTNGGTLLNMALDDVNVAGKSRVGGLVGHAEGTTITNSYATGSVSGNQGSGFYVGGLVGRGSAQIRESYSTASVSGFQEIGGLVGWNEVSGTTVGSIDDSYATGSVTAAKEIAGGLVGRSQGNISRSYASGRVSGSAKVGGLLGQRTSTTVIDAGYWDTDSSGQALGVGATNGAAADQQKGVTGLTTHQAFAQTSYAGFDFTSKWFVFEGASRPFQRWEYSTTITRVSQLALMAVDLGASYTLARDLDLSQVANFMPIGSRASPFTGSLNGQNHTLTGLTINRPTQDDVGLFGATGPGSVIQDLTLSGPSVSGANQTGGLVGYSGGGTISGIDLSGLSVSGANQTGGLVGQAAAGGTVNGVTVSGAVTGRGSVGGLVGMNQGAVSGGTAHASVFGGGSSQKSIGGLVGLNEAGGVIDFSRATGSVAGINSVGGLVGDNRGEVSRSAATGEVRGSVYVGGLVGFLGKADGASQAGRVSRSYAEGSVSATAASSFAGGLVGYVDYGQVSDSYATGAVSGRDYVGGLVGRNYDRISNSYAAGAVTGAGTRVGGLVGANETAGRISRSSWDTQATGRSKGVGFGSATGATARSTELAMQESSYAGWDFASADPVWRITAGATYPELVGVTPQRRVRPPANDELEAIADLEVALLEMDDGVHDPVQELTQDLEQDLALDSTLDLSPDLALASTAASAEPFTQESSTEESTAQDSTAPVPGGSSTTTLGGGKLLKVMGVGVKLPATELVPGGTP